MRNWVCNGEALVILRFGNHISGTIDETSNPLMFFAASDPTFSGEFKTNTKIDAGGNVTELERVLEAEPNFIQTFPSMFELGLAQEGISISPRSFHKDINVDDFGPDVPPEIMYNLTDVGIRMKMIHYDNTVLKLAIAESFAGGAGLDVPEGVLAPAGSMMGRGKPLFASGNHFVSMSILSPVLREPWHFPTCYLREQPFEYPLGTEKSVVDLNWRAIPYVPLLVSGYVPAASGRFQEITSRRPVLWNRNPANITDSTILAQLTAF